MKREEMIGPNFPARYTEVWPNRFDAIIAQNNTPPELDSRLVGSRKGGDGFPR